MAKNRWYSSKYLWLALITISAIGGFGAYKLFTVKADKPIYIFGSVDRGDIVMQVAATGTLAAVTTVQVGTQVSGTIQEMHADFNSEVKKGQLLAKLDPELLRAALEQQEASVRTAEATLNDDAAAIAATKANLDKAKVDVLDRQRKFRRQKELFEQNLVPRDDLDSAESNLNASLASQKATEAQLVSAEARVKADESRLNQAKANLHQAQVNLDHSIILSPISGTIISRSVDTGQTVQASFSSPTLFTIAADLTKMQVNTNIDEADVSRIKVGMDASFSVDAYTGENFRGSITQIRLSTTTVQNVVTYNAIIDVPNEQLKLKPGMTANVKIVIESEQDTLKIPNSALRFRPAMTDAEVEQAFKRSGEEKYFNYAKSMNQLRTFITSPASSTATSTPQAMAQQGGGNQGGNRQAGNQGGGGRGGDRGGAPRRDPNAMAARSRRGQRVPVWVQGEDKEIRPVIVKLGLSDGVSTQIEDSKLKQGDKIIIGMEVDPNRPTTTTTRPPGFGGMPGMPGMGGGSRGR